MVLRAYQSMLIWFIDAQGEGHGLTGTSSPVETVDVQEVVGGVFPMVRKFLAIKNELGIVAHKTPTQS